MGGAEKKAITDDSDGAERMALCHEWLSEIAHEGKSSDEMLLAARIQWC